jgi:hypothetical protein
LELIQRKKKHRNLMRLQKERKELAIIPTSPPTRTSIAGSSQEAMQAMPVQVRRRAAAIDTAFDATVARLSGSYTDAVACMAEQVAAAGVAALR